MGRIEYSISFSGSSKYISKTQWDPHGGTITKTSQSGDWDPQLMVINYAVISFNSISSTGYCEIDSTYEGSVVVNSETGQKKKVGGHLLYITPISSGQLTYRSGDDGSLGLSKKILTDLTNKGDKADITWWNGSDSSGSKVSPGSATLYIYTSPKYEKSTIGTQHATFGSVNKVVVNNKKASELHHVITWSLSSDTSYKQKYYAQYEIPKGSSASAYTVEKMMPRVWMEAIPENSKTNLYINVYTYVVSQSTQTPLKLVGVTKSVRMIGIPSDVKPTYDAIYLNVYDHTPTGYATTNHIYIQNLTGVFITIENPQPGYGAYFKDNGYNVSSAVITDDCSRLVFDSSDDRYDADAVTAWKACVMKQTWYDADKFNSGEYVVFYIDRLTGAGNIQLAMVLKDSRRIACDTWYNTQASYAVYSQPYSPPVVSSAIAFRCDGNGIASATGTYATIRVKAAVSGFKIEDNTTSESTTQNKMNISVWYYNGSSQQRVVYNSEKNKIITLSNTKIESIDEKTTVITIGSHIQPKDDSAEGAYDLSNDVTYMFGGSVTNMSVPEFSSEVSYAAGDYVIYNNTVYKCIRAVVSGNDFDAEEWEQSSIKDNYLDPKSNYVVVFVVTDASGGQTTVRVPINSVGYSLHIKSGGDGVAVGTASKTSGAFEINKEWDFIWRNNRMSPIVYAIDESYINPIDGLIWVKKKN